MSDSLPVIAIVGAGFGGLRAAQALSHARVHVVLVDQHNYHLFQPLLYQVATAGLSPDQIAYPARAIFRKQSNLEFRLARVNSIDLDGCRLHTGSGDIHYDYLILAVGGVTNFFGLAGVERNGFGLKDVDDAVQIRNHLLRAFELAMLEKDPETRRALLTFVVAGGGPTGIEAAGALSELIRLVLVKDYRDLDIKDVRVLLLEATTQLLAGLPPQLQEAAAETLWQKHIEVRFGASVVDYDGQRVALKGGESIPARTLVWAAGVRAEPLADTLGVRQGKQARLLVTPTLQLPDHRDVFVIGDAAYLQDGNGALPMVAPVAIQQGKLAAENVERLLRGEQPADFQYKDPGTLATIGRSAAVAHIGRWNFAGFLAWLLWLGVHLFWLIGFRNRLLVMINWAWDYFLYERGVRVITTE